MTNRDLATLLSFWRVQGQGFEWRPAFQMAFGEPIESFYARVP
jgi:hypothetical protein